MANAEHPAMQGGRWGHARFVRGARWAGFVVVLAASSRAAAGGVPAFKDACDTVNARCVTQAGLSGTCLAAECRQTADPQTDPLVDANTTIACSPCAVCEAPGAFAICTDTIACGPGFFCFDYGVNPVVSEGPQANPIQFSVWAVETACLEGGVGEGPAVAPSWAPCGGGLPPLGNGSSSSGGTVVGAGSSGSADVEDGGAEGLFPIETPAPVDASVADNRSGSAPSNREPVLDLSRGGCDVGADAAAEGIPLLGVVLLWILRRRRA